MLVSDGEDVRKLPLVGAQRCGHSQRHRACVALVAALVALPDLHRPVASRYSAIARDRFTANLGSSTTNTAKAMAVAA